MRGSPTVPTKRSGFCVNRVRNVTREDVEQPAQLYAPPEEAALPAPPPWMTCTSLTDPPGAMIGRNRRGRRRS